MHTTDLPSLTNLIIDAFLPSTTWQYLLLPNFPSHEPQFRACMIQQVQREWHSRHRASTFANVITVRQPATDDDEIASVAIWNVRDSTTHHDHHNAPLSLLFDPATCPGLNTTRLASLTAQQTALEERYLSPLAPRQLYLHTLATHPSWDGHGFAAAQCVWGQNLAVRMEVPVTLTATEAGWVVYDGLGFEGLRNLTLRGVEGEETGAWVEAMVWEGR